jgi:hypothetical protein
MSKCKACGAPIVWIGTPSGKIMPCDAKPMAYREDIHGKAVIMTSDGQTVKCMLDTTPEAATGIGYTPHWATCPHAAKFKPKTKNK